MKRILCFGDSNTWGYIPASGTLVRYDEKSRWTRLLQEKLLGKAEVVEFGICGCVASGRNLKPLINIEAPSLFPSVLFASLPLDAVMIMLGTNDLKSAYGWKAGDTARGIKKLVDAVRMISPATRIILAPAVILDDRIVNDPEFTADAVENSRLCAKEVKELSSEEKLAFFDTNAFVKDLGADGCHWAKESHAAFASALAEFLTKEGGLL